MIHPLREVASLLNLDASKVVDSPSLILLCGGPVNTKCGRDPSLRALFYEQLKQTHPDFFRRVLLAEDATSWAMADSRYENLFELENDLAYLSAIILVVVESAGSIAELGAFCQAFSLRKRLVAIVERGYYDEDPPSFIRAGPVTLLEDSDPESVIVYEWLVKDSGDGVRPLKLDLASQAVGRLIAELARRVRRVKKEGFRSGDRGHRLLLIADLIDLGLVTQFGEINSFLRSLGVRLSDQRLRRYLFVLEKLNLIRRTKDGRVTFFLAGQEAATFVDYSYKQRSRPWDRLRTKDDVRASLFKRDRDREKVFKSFL